mmetsp:Transcript_27438/g.64546  ORF Transcript_27438/g.64546 Transcript_27438/m.64546 type:complete len:389 (+) Transcript_27438:181-1347(+)
MGRAVHAAVVLVVLPLQADVAVLSPRRTPGVANGPVQLPIFLAVAHEPHSMIDVDVFGDVARVGDAGAVGVPAGGIHRDGERAVVHNRVHDIRKQIRLRLHPAGDGDHLIGGGMELHLRAAVDVIAEEGLVRDHILVGHAMLLDVVHGELRCRAIAAAGAAAVLRVLGTGHQLLGGQNGQDAGVNGCVALHHTRRGKGPARSAVALILGRRHDGREGLAPVHLLWVLLVLAEVQGLHLEGRGLALHLLQATEGLQLLRRPVRVDVNGNLVGLGGIRVVGLNGRQGLLECLLPRGILAGLGVVLLPEVLDVLVEAVILRWPLEVHHLHHVLGHIGLVEASVEKDGVLLLPVASASSRAFAQQLGCCLHQSRREEASAHHGLLRALTQGR